MSTLSFDLSAGGSSDVYDVIIIGGGPAGASAAIYTSRADLKTLVIDKGLTAGALGITAKISNYPGVPGPISGADLTRIMREQAESFGAEFVTDKVVGVETSGEIKMVTGGTGFYQGRALILATGSMGRSGSTPGEEDLLGRGVSYCATCDGAFFRGQNVAVVGNNDEALEEALFLAKFVERVHLIVPTPEWKASSEMAHEVEANDLITIYKGTRLKAVEGTDGVTGVRVHPRGGEEQVIPVTGAFLYLQGNKPITDYLGDALPTSDDGCLSVNGDMATGIPGVFATGDLLCAHIKQAVIAASDGVQAAIAADKYLNQREKVRADWS